MSGVDDAGHAGAELPTAAPQPAADGSVALDVVITYLEMTARPVKLPPMPVGPKVALVAATAPPVHYFLYLYGTIGRSYAWTDWFEADAAAREAFVADPKVELFTMMLDGWPGGFFMLDTREQGVCDLAYFGLMPEALGRGLGAWLLGEAIESGWDRPGVERLTVNTCTLDHPAALPLYQKLGFRPIGRTQERHRVSAEIAARQG